MLLLFGAPRQHSLLAGREHGRTIPLAEVQSTTLRRRYSDPYDGSKDVVAVHRTAWLVVQPRRGLHIEQRTYGISTGTGSLELSVILFSPEIFTSNATSEIATPSEQDAITFIFGPSSCNDLTVHL